MIRFCALVNFILFFFKIVCLVDGIATIDFFSQFIPFKTVFVPRNMILEKSFIQISIIPITRN